MLDKNNTIFKEDIEIEASFKKEVAAQLQVHNDTMMETINQYFTSFQSVILQTIKKLVIQMIPRLSNKHRSNLISPWPHDMVHTQPSNYQYPGVVLNHSYPPQTIPYSPLTNIPPSSIQPHTPPTYIPPQPTQCTILPTHQILPPFSHHLKVWPPLTFHNHKLLRESNDRNRCWSMMSAPYE